MFLVPAHGGGCAADTEWGQAREAAGRPAVHRMDRQHPAIENKVATSVHGAQVDGPWKEDEDERTYQSPALCPVR